MRSDLPVGCDGPGCELSRLLPQEADGARPRGTVPGTPEEALVVDVSPEQRTEWTRLADRLSAEYAGYDATIEVLASDIGDNPMVERMPFDHVTYDHEDDVLVVAVGGREERHPVVLRHLIDHPRELLVDQNPEGAALKVTDVSGTTTLVSLLRPRDGAQGA